MLCKLENFENTSIIVVVVDAHVNVVVVIVVGYNIENFCKIY